LRLILGFIEETREYLTGRLRKGTTVSGKETAVFIASIKGHLPGCVKQVLLRADGEFLSWESVAAAIAAGFQFIIANKGCEPPFEPGQWYRPYKRHEIEFNSCTYQPIGWGCVCRFVAMRIPKEREQFPKEPVQRMLFEDDNYTYRIFCTSLLGKAYKVIAEYDKRADVENLVGEAKREGLEMIPSAKFKNNYALFSDSDAGLQHLALYEDDCPQEPVLSRYFDFHFYCVLLPHFTDQPAVYCKMPRCNLLNSMA